MDPQLYRELLAVADPDGQALLQRWTVTSRDGGTRIKDPRWPPTLCTLILLSWDGM